MSGPWSAEPPAPGLVAPDVVVVVDDDRLVLELLGRIIAALPAVRVVGFADPVAALDWCRSNPADVVITDYQMPGLCGSDLIRALREEPEVGDIPVMMITASSERSVRVEALDAGVTDVLSKPIDAAEVRARTRNMLAIRRGQRLQAERSSSLEREVQLATAAIAARERETILRLSKAAEFRDWETGSHIVRVSLYARLIGRELGLDPGEQEILLQAAPMHDVGKIAVPDSILLKPGSLEPSEYELIKQHTVIGHQILGGSSSELLQAAAEIALSHHERYDGGGYPYGLRAEAIPLRGRVVSVADTFDALTSHRPYKEPWPASLAWSFLEQHAGTRFDPACVAAFQRVQRDSEEVRAAFPDPTEPELAGRRAGPATAAAEGL